ncbi:MAG: modification methylase [Elusimicrobia bacterium HGW-Elusimicrobia-1]|jgi:DNA adenine methylase|nr:MAG: modification methylase [Elusimicrobia bacterium HGW-Elusimicrobia-1]
MTKVKPFVKWAGGKTQLLDELADRLPSSVKESGVIDNYIEPFVGGGAFFFYLKARYDIKNAVLIDNNTDLINAYKIVKNNSRELIKRLATLQKSYLKKTSAERERFFYKMRDEYNRARGKRVSSVSDRVNRAALLIALNKTCFNGLYRQNSKGKFNVPHGRYKNPRILDEENLLAVSRALKGVKLIRGDFERARGYARRDTLIYFDPPYRPLNATSSFTAYTKDGFSDDDQRRLAKLCRDLSDLDASLILSNSDPGNENARDRFFHKIYDGFNISRVEASRMLNCDGARRGHISELLISNF